MSSDLQMALDQLIQGRHTCVLRKDERIYFSNARGIAPLLGWLDQGLDLRGFSAADKVVGKGAAFVYVLLGVRAVHALVMSHGAKAVLEAYGIAASCDSCPPRILNRDKTGFCPIETAVGDISEPQEALAAIRARLVQLRK